MPVNLGSMGPHERAEKVSLSATYSWISVPCWIDDGHIFRISLFEIHGPELNATWMELEASLFNFTGFEVLLDLA